MTRETALARSKGLSLVSVGRTWSLRREADKASTEGQTRKIARFCAERLSDYKVPDLVTFLSEPLARNANGKVLKTELRGPA